MCQVRPFKKGNLMQTIFIALSAFFFVAAIILLIVFLSEKSKNHKFVSESLTRKNDMEKMIQLLNIDIERLSRYENIANADEKAKEILAEAQNIVQNGRLESDKIIVSANQTANEYIANADNKAKEMLEEAQRIVQYARLESDKILADAEQTAQYLISQTKVDSDKISDEAKENAKLMKETAKNILDSATVESSKIIEDAKVKAQEIAEKAYEALKKADLYEKTAIAMKNIIQGYGDEYIIPEKSLLDDLADDFGFTQAGEELKKARDRTKLMIKNNTAARCDKQH